jgi:drug/metabolite transporter (DMT)-like permease
VLLATVGVGFVTLSNGALRLNQGDFWTLLCAFSFTGYMLYADKASKSGETFSLGFLQAALVCVLAGGMSQTAGGDIQLPQHWNVWVSILFCSIFASVIAFDLQLRFQKYVSPSKTAIIFALEPVFATIAAALYLKEKITLNFFIGAILIFIAILLSEQKAEKKVLPQD